MKNNIKNWFFGLFFVFIHKTLSLANNFILFRFLSSRQAKKPQKIDRKPTNAKKKLNKDKTKKTKKLVFFNFPKPPLRLSLPKDKMRWR